MKRGFVILLFTLFTFLGCKKGGLNTGSEGNTVSGSAGVPVMATNSRVSQILQKNIWMIEFYVSSSNFEAGKSNRGRWFIFKNDGTFQSGHWENKTGSGSWYLKEDSKYPVVIIDSFNDAEDAAWEIQGIPEDAYEMSLVGIKDYPNYADLVKFFNMLTPPTKAQFGEQ